MFRNIKILFTQSIIYGIGTIFERVLAFLMLPLFTNFLSQEDFGTYTLWFSYVIILNPLFLFGQNTALIRFYGSVVKRDEQISIFSTAFWTVIMAATIFSGIGLLAFRPLMNLLFETQTGAGSLTLFLIIVLWLDSINLLALNLLKAENRAFSFAWISILCGIAIPLVTVYLLILLKMKAIGAVLAILVVATLKLGLLTLVVIRRRLRFTFSIDYFKKMARFGLPFVPTILAASLMVTLDRILIDKMIGKAAVGIYAAGCRLGMFISLLTKAFQYAWEPFIAANFQKPDAKQIFSKVLTYFVLVTGLVYILVVLFVDDIVRIKIGNYTFFGADFYESTAVVPLIMLGSLCYGIYLNFIVGAYAQKKSGYFLLFTGLAALVNLVLNFLLIPVWGMQGAALATVGSYGVMLLGMFLLNQKIYPISYEYPRILKIVVLLLLPLLIVTLGDWWQNTSVKILLVLLLPFLLVLFKVFEKEELHRIKQLVWFRKGK